MKLPYEKPQIMEKKIPIEALAEKIEQEKNLKFINKLFKEFPESEVFLVGGIVRDILLKRPESKDYDLVVRNVPARELEDFLSREGIVNLVGKTFGVFKFVPEDSRLPVPIDVALPRREHALGTGGYRDFEVQSNPELPIEEDLSRRDFSINAMAWDVRRSKLVDPYEGLLDLQEKKIRAVGDSEERFKEDYSRMLRAIRFACQLGFEIENKTWEKLKGLIFHINDTHDKERIVPYEVIAKEFLKSIKADAVRAIVLYDASGVLGELIPEMLPMKGCPQPLEFHTEGDVWEHTLLALSKVRSNEFQKFFLRQESESIEGGKGEEPSIETVLGILFHDIGKPVAMKTPESHGTDRIRFDGHDKVGAEMTGAICRRLKLSSAEGFEVVAERVAWLVRYHMLFLSADPEKMKKTTVEKYFFNPKYDGRGLLHLAFADASSTLGPEGEVYYDNLEKMLRVIKELQKMGFPQKNVLPKALLNGNEIMKLLKIKPGPKVGEVITALREEQLAGRIKTKKAAREFVDTNIRIDTNDTN